MHNVKEWLYTFLSPPYVFFFVFYHHTLTILNQKATNQQITP
jgi:hypothetical protein